MQYAPLPTTANQCQPLSTTVNHCQPLPTAAFPNISFPFMTLRRLFSLISFISRSSIYPKGTSSIASFSFFFFLHRWISFLFRCVLASLYEGLSFRGSVNPSVRGPVWTAFFFQWADYGRKWSEMTRKPVLHLPQFSKLVKKSSGLSRNVPKCPKMANSDASLSERTCFVTKGFCSHVFHCPSG